MSQPSSRNPAQTYEDYFVPGLFRPWTEELLERADPQPGTRILDLACGTGIVARTVFQRLHGRASVVGLDLSPAMITVARDISDTEGLAIDWHVGNAGALPFPGAAFDLVLIQQGLQFFPDKAAALAEVRRVLVAGGLVVVAVWTAIANNPFYEAFGEAVHRRLGTPAMHAPFSLGSRETLRALFVDAGFAKVEIEVVRRSVSFASPDRFVDLGFAAAAAAVPALQAMDEGEMAALSEAIRAEMREPVRRYTKSDALVFPMEAHVVVARTA